MHTRAEVAKMIDHTLLKPEATHTQVAALAEEAGKLGTFSICVSPSMLPVTTPPGVAVATVVGFPSGAVDMNVKAMEASTAIANGADEIDMVINLAFAKEGQWDKLTEEIAAVKQACGNNVLKVIIESAALTDEEIIESCKAAEAAGADFVKTSTGFHPSGGATTHAVELMSKTVNGRLGVKASGGIRTPEAALAMIEAGATRLGLSASTTILDGLPQ
ncbi:MAG: deoxyribose-phosphate aldolase [Corynebacterium sp.]|nr:deoxyribose-phosphate aldolase [Corynebacterium sp.]